MLQVPAKRERGRKSVDVGAILSAAEWEATNLENTQGVRLTSPSKATVSKWVKSNPTSGYSVQTDYDAEDGGFFVLRPTPKGRK